MQNLTVRPFRKGDRVRSTDAAHKHLQWTFRRYGTVATTPTGERLAVVAPGCRSAHYYSPTFWELVPDDDIGDQRLPEATAPPVGPPKAPFVPTRPTRPANCPVCADGGMTCIYDVDEHGRAARRICVRCRQISPIEPQQLRRAV